MLYGIPLWQQFIFAFIATGGFSILFNVSREHLIYVSFIGAIGWVVYLLVYSVAPNPGYSSFCAAFVVSLLGEIFARRRKQPAILFVISGILPLVPGLTLYNMMLNIVLNNHSIAARKGGDALLIGSGIALGVLIVTSMSRTFNIFQLRRSIRLQASERYKYFMNMGKNRSKLNTESIQKEIQDGVFDDYEEESDPETEAQSLVKEFLDRFSEERRSSSTGQSKVDKLTALLEKKESERARIDAELEHTIMEKQKLKAELDNKKHDILHGNDAAESLVGQSETLDNGSKSDVVFDSYKNADDNDGLNDKSENQNAVSDDKGTDKNKSGGIDDDIKGIL